MNNSSEPTAATSEDVTLLIHNDREQNFTVTSQEALISALTDAYNKAHVPHKFVASDPIPTDLLSPFYSTKHSLFASLPSDLQEDETSKPTFK